MHYIPDNPKYQDDEIEDQGSGGSSRQTRESKASSSKGSTGRGQKGRRRTGSSAVPPPPTDQKKTTPQKAAKKLRSLIARAFAKQQLPPTEQDGLMAVIDCEPHQYDAASVLTTTPKSPSINSPTTPPQQQWSRMRQSGLSGDVLVPTMHQTAPDFFDAVDNQGEEADRSFQDDDASITHTQREVLRAKAQKEIRARMSFSAWQCIIAIWVYIILSVLCFSGWLEAEWTLLESSYFAVVTFTTIGYGDVVPDTRNARMFTCIWALSGVAFLGVALGILGSNLIVFHEQRREDAQVRRLSQVVKGFLHHYANRTKKDDDQDPSHNQPNATINPSPRSMPAAGGYRNIVDGMDHYSGTSCWKQYFSCLCMGSFLPLLVFLVGTLYLISVFEDWDVHTTIYYGIITASTVGYGDFSPKTHAGRFVAILFIPAAVCVMGFFLNLVSRTIIEYQRHRYTSYLLGNRPFTLEDIRNWDSDGDGEVTREEFIEFMLVAMEKVDKGLLDDLKARFNSLDVDGSGTIDKEDLAIVARQRLQKDCREKLKCPADNDGLLQPTSRYQVR